MFSPYFLPQSPENNKTFLKKYYNYILCYTAIGAVEGEFYISFKNSPSDGLVAFGVKAANKRVFFKGIGGAADGLPAKG